MCRERLCPNCEGNDWMLVEMPQSEVNQLGQRKVHFMLQCRKCRKVYFSGEYWAGKKYPPLSEEFNPSRRNSKGERIAARRKS